MHGTVLTLRELADSLKGNEKPVDGLTPKRQLPGLTVGGQWRFRREDLEAWVPAQRGAARATTPTPQRFCAGAGRVK